MNNDNSRHNGGPSRNNGRPANNDNGRSNANNNYNHGNGRERSSSARRNDNRRNGNDNRRNDNDNRRQNNDNRRQNNDNRRQNNDNRRHYNDNRRQNNGNRRPYNNLPRPDNDNRRSEYGNQQQVGNQQPNYNRGHDNNYQNYEHNPQVQPQQFPPPLHNNNFQHPPPPQTASQPALADQPSTSTDPGYYPPPTSSNNPQQSADDSQDVQIRPRRGNAPRSRPKKGQYKRRGQELTAKPTMGPIVGEIENRFEEELEVFLTDDVWEEHFPDSDPELPLFVTKNGFSQQQIQKWATLKVDHYDTDLYLISHQNQGLTAEYITYDEVNNRYLLFGVTLLSSSPFDIYGIMIAPVVEEGCKPNRGFLITAKNQGLGKQSRAVWNSIAVKHEQLELIKTGRIVKATVHEIGERDGREYGLVTRTLDILDDAAVRRHTTADRVDDIAYLLEGAPWNSVTHPEQHDRLNFAMKDLHQVVTNWTQISIAAAAGELNMEVRSAQKDRLEDITPQWSITAGLVKCTVPLPNQSNDPSDHKIKFKEGDDCHFTTIVPKIVQNSGPTKKTAPPSAGAPAEPTTEAITMSCEVHKIEFMPNTPPTITFKFAQRESMTLQRRRITKKHLPATIQRVVDLEYHRAQCNQLNKLKSIALQSIVAPAKYRVLAHLFGQDSWKTELPEPDQVPEDFLIEPAMTNVRLNPMQRQIGLLAKRTNNRVMLVQGQPGTGKTTFIVAFIRDLVRDSGLKVLVVAYTHTAAEAIAAMFFRASTNAPEDGIRGIRLYPRKREGHFRNRCEQHGLHYLTEHTDPLDPRFDRIRELLQPIHGDDNPEHLMATTEWDSLTLQQTINIQNKIAEGQARMRKDRQEAESMYMEAVDPNVTVGTMACILDKRMSAKFDVIITDEAAATMEPAVNTLLNMLDPKGKGLFMLVGDQEQLPAVVVQGGPVGEFLQSTAHERMPNILHNIQMFGFNRCYRMHSSILAWVSKTPYGGLLLSGNDNDEGHMYSSQYMPWPRKNHVMLFDVVRGEVVATPGNSCANLAEIQAALQYIIFAKRRGIDLTKVAILCAYDGQKIAMRQALAENPVTADISNLNSICCSVDAMQGSEAELVLVLFTRSQENCHTSNIPSFKSLTAVIGFLVQSKRLNVALSRARSGMVVIGDAYTLRLSKYMSGFIDHCRSNGSLVSGYWKSLQEAHDVPVGEWYTEGGLSTIHQQTEELNMELIPCGPGPAVIDLGDDPPYNPDEDYFNEYPPLPPAAHRSIMRQDAPSPMEEALAEAQDIQAAVGVVYPIPVAEPAPIPVARIAPEPMEAVDGAVYSPEGEFAMDTQ